MGRLLRVLIAEDSEDDTELMLREMKRGGFDPVYERVDTPLAMLNSLDRGKWDIVIGDHSIPNLSTATVLTLLKERNLDLPYIIVSGSIDEKVAFAALTVGAQDFLRKDELDKLVPAIERALRGPGEENLLHKVEKALCESEELFRTLVESSADIVLILSENGNITYLNSAVEQVVGYQPEELMGKNPLGLIHPGDGPRILRIFEEGRDALGSVKKFECRFRHKKGYRRILEGVGKNLLDVPSVEGIVVTCRDITDRKRKEEKE